MKARDLLIDFLSKNTTCCQVKNEAIVTRCPFCGDSVRKLYNYGHVYVFPESDFFICFRCGEKGFISKLLRGYLQNQQVSVDKKLLDYFDNLKLSFRKKFEIKQDDIVFQDYDFDYDNQNISLSQKTYQLERLDYLPTFKILYDWEKVFEITNFLHANHPIVHRIKQDREFRLYFQENAIGFVGIRGKKINIRFITNKPYRYCLIQYGEGFDCYSTHNYPFAKFQDDFEIVIAEGPYDILNKKVYLNHNPIRVSVFSKRILIRVLERLSILFMRQISFAHFLLDADVDRQFWKAIYMSNKPYTNRIFGYKNSKGKDFGENEIEIQLIRR